MSRLCLFEPKELIATFGFRLRKRRHLLDPHLRRATYTIEVPKHSQRVTHMLEPFDIGCHHNG